MKNKVLFLGDLHFKVTNNDVTDVFIDQTMNALEKLFKIYGEDLICVIGGDLLDTHERLHLTPYNKVIKFIDMIRKITELFILVGNHDYENNQQFLTDKHWLNPLKKWSNVTIVDKVIYKYNYVFLPYVPVGRFLEALDTLSEVDWRTATCIFAHQEFRGCDLGTQISENGDKYAKHYPLVISGHIHKKHQPQENIIYPGSVIQHNFGEENNETGLCFINFEEKEPRFETIKVTIPKLTTMIINSDEFDKIKNIKIMPLERIRVIVKGEEENFKRIKKTNLYNNLPIGIYVVFRSDNDNFEEGELKFNDFDKILNEYLKENKLEKLFALIDNNTTLEDIIDVVMTEDE